MPTVTYWMMQREIRTKKGGFTRAVRDLLGVEYPPVKGWPDRFLGKQISEHTYALILDSNRDFEIVQTMKAEFKKDFSPAATGLRAPDATKLPWE